MSDDFDTGFKPGEIHVDYPIWVLFDSREISPLGKPQITGLVRHSKGAEPVFVPLFTDWDLALRFIADYNPVACGLPFGKAQLETLLSHLEQAGEALIGFDPGPHSARRITVSEALAAVRWKNQ